MKKNLMYLLLMVLLMMPLAACTDTSKDTPNPSVLENDQSSNKPAASETPQKKDFAGQTLSISVTNAYYYILEPYVEKFKTVYPGVELVLNQYEWGTYSQQVGTQIMAGEADDIIDSSRLDIRKISERGLLADFYPLMQNDPDFHEEDYYMNVLDAVSYNGKLTMFPISFFYYVVGVNSRFSEQAVEQFNSYKTITGRQMLDLYNSLENKDGRYLCCSNDSELLFYTGVYSFIDFENKKCYFNTPEFIKFLTDLKNCTSSKMSGHYKRESIESLDYLPDLVNPGVLEEFALQYLFQPFFEDTYREYLMFLPEAQKEIFTHFIPYTTDDNELIVFENESYCINEASPNKALAWEFLKFITTPEANEGASLIGASVNRELVKAFTPSNMTFFVNRFQNAGFTMDGEAADVVTQVKAMLEPYHDMPMICYQIGGTGDNRIDSKFYRDDFIAFLDGVLTADQAAASMQNKVSLYLAE